MFECRAVPWSVLCVYATAPERTVGSSEAPERDARFMCRRRGHGHQYLPVGVVGDDDELDAEPLLRLRVAHTRRTHPARIPRLAASFYPPRGAHPEEPEAGNALAAGLPPRKLDRQRELGLYSGDRPQASPPAGTVGRPRPQVSRPLKNRSHVQFLARLVLAPPPGSAGM